ncbi:Perilipin-3 [Sphaceloma murrayae]|uniref:Perilipin-3 n=1 Tax=Sphaceloma murrayae TaxID=2082308 RepID=A0A2K1QJW5_9PEZI|nr:Perilipin-3 [Sphaceloma murrayae]
MSQTQVLTNGDQKSQFLSHLVSYPIVSDGVDTVKSNQYGARSIEIADAAYTKVGKPLEPHLRTPYSYAKPYVEKADTLADKALTGLDKRFPIVKEDTNTILGTVKSFVFWPLSVANDGKDYVLNTWSDEYEKTVKRNGRGSGVWNLTVSVISTEMRIVSDGLQIAADFLGPKKEEAAQKKNEFVDQAKQKKDSYAQKLQNKE